MPRNKGKYQLEDILEPHKVVLYLPAGVENKHKTSILDSATLCSFKTFMAKFTVEPEA